MIGLGEKGSVWGGQPIDMANAGNNKKKSDWPSVPKNEVPVRVKARVGLGFGLGFGSGFGSGLGSGLGLRLDQWSPQRSP